MHDERREWANMSMMILSRWAAKFVAIACIAGLVPTVPAVNTSAAETSVVAHFKPPAEVERFDVYHKNEHAFYVITITVPMLLDDGYATHYVSVRDDEVAFAELYHAFESTTVRATARCPADIDARWLVVVTYEDKTKDGIGMSQLYNDGLQCAQWLSSRETFAISDGLSQYLRKTFPFMR
ncbi:MAG: hypothetical protein JO036_08885 [Candidatus Eremiobacteraeota bacterium]|nr:hypothetical protein [Candidatus Eremiobacteraeota bacterium]